MDSGGDNPADTEVRDSSDTPPGGQEGPPRRGMPPEPSSGPILAALQRQARGPQASAPGPGNTADSLGKLKIATDLMELAKSGFEESSQQWKDIERALEELQRHLPETGNTSGLEETHLVDLLRRQKQNPVLQAISNLMGGGRGGRGGRRGGQASGQGPQPPPPSTPLPGA
jgi:hypothetical protein